MFRVKNRPTEGRFIRIHFYDGHLWAQTFAWDDEGNLRHFTGTGWLISREESPLKCSYFVATREEARVIG